jgi:hypothetical protein
MLKRGIGMDWKALSAERRKTYAESVQRTNRFVISTLTILLILVVIVQQELVTAKFQAKKLRREVVKATERLDQITQILAYQFLRFRVRFRVKSLFLT